MWPWALVPAAVFLALTCVLGWLAVGLADQATVAVMGEPDGVWRQLGGWLLYLLLVAAALLLALLVALFLAQPLSGFALDRIVLAQERALGVRMPTDASFVGATYV